MKFWLKYDIAARGLVSLTTFVTTLAYLFVFCGLLIESAFAQAAVSERISHIRWSGQNGQHAEFVIAHTGANAPRIEAQNEKRKRLRFINTVLPEDITNLRSHGAVIGVFPQQDGADALIDIVTNTKFDVIVRSISQNTIIEIIPQAEVRKENVELDSFAVNTLPNGAVTIELRSEYPKQPTVINITDGVRILWAGVKLAADFALEENTALQHLDAVRVLSRSPMELELTSKGVIGSDLVAIDRGYLVILLPEDAGRSPTLSLDFKELSSVEIIRALTHEAELNVLFETLPDEPISLVATNITPYRALSIIAQKTNAQLDYSHIENRWYLKERNSPGASTYRVFPLKHARADELTQVLSADFISGISRLKEGEGEESLGESNLTSSSLSKSESNLEVPDVTLNQSQKLSIRADTRSNALVVSGAIEDINTIEHVVEELDRPQVQVQIEALIVEVDKEYAQNVGVRWGGRRSIDYPNILGYKGANRAVISGSGQNTSAPNSPLSPEEYSVDMGADNISTKKAASIGLSLIASEAGVTDLLNVQLSALEAEGLAQILASPRLMTSNHYSASIEQGVERLFEVSSDENAELLSKRAVLGIEVTPHVYANDVIQMELVVKQDSFDAMDESAMHTKHISSTIRAHDGETIILGGIYQQEEYTRGVGVPAIRKIPLLKWLFSNEMKGQNARELVVLLTPRIETLMMARLKNRPFGQPVPERS